MEEVKRGGDGEGGRRWGVEGRGERGTGRDVRGYTTYTGCTVYYTVHKQ